MCAHAYTCMNINTQKGRGRERKKGGERERKREGEKAPALLALCCYLDIKWECRDLNLSFAAVGFLVSLPTILWRL